MVQILAQTDLKSMREKELLIAKVKKHKRPADGTPPTVEELLIRIESLERIVTLLSE